MTYVITFIIAKKALHLPPYPLLSIKLPVSLLRLPPHQHLLRFVSAKESRKVHELCLGRVQRFGIGIAGLKS